MFYFIADISTFNNFTDLDWTIVSWWNWHPVDDVALVVDLHIEVCIKLEERILFIDKTSFEEFSLRSQRLGREVNHPGRDRPLKTVRNKYKK